MLDATATGGGVGDLARIGTRERHQVAQGLVRRVALDQQNDRGGADQRDGGDQLLQVEQLQHRMDRREAVVDVQQRVSVGRGCLQRLQGDLEIAARAVFHDHRLLEVILEHHAQRPGGHVGRTPGGQGDDDAQDSAGEVTLSAKGQCQAGGGGGGHMQDAAARDLVGVDHVGLLAVSKTGNKCRTTGLETNFKV